jgi:hypothetical protein
VTQHVRVNHNHVLESSWDLQSWTPAGSPFAAHDDHITQEFEIEATGQFLRNREVL